MLTTAIVRALPEISEHELDARLERLHEDERTALQALGAARLLNLPGRAATSEVRRIREELEGLYAARRLLEAHGRL